MNEAQKKRLEALRQREAKRVKAAQKATPVPPHIPPMGSFGEDDPETHASFAIGPLPESPDPDTI